MQRAGTSDESEATRHEVHLRGLGTNTWDSQNRLVQSVINGKTSSFTYGADGLRRKMSVQSGTGDHVVTHYLLDGQNVVQERTPVRKAVSIE